MWMYFVIEDDDFFKQYNTIWDKVSADTKKEFDSQLACNKNSLKTKLKSYGDKEIPNVDCNRTCLTVMSLHSIFKRIKTVILKCF